jgi:NADH-quinone oxidoreductase subunit E
VLQELEKQLKVKAGETTRDGLFSIEVVACIGACGLAPVVAINGEFHAKVTAASLGEIIDSYKIKAEENEAA